MSQRIAAWVVQVFGEDVLRDRVERAARVLEEALELAQACGVSRETAEGLVARVYARPPGDAAIEAAQVGVCLIAWAEGAQEDLGTLVDDEIDRIESLPVEKIRARHAAKVRAGIAREVVVEEKMKIEELAERIRLARYDMEILKIDGVPAESVAREAEVKQ
jgi:hypothetical protein